MNWHQIREKVYDSDAGTLRDIYVLETNVDDWRSWVDFVNTTCIVRWKNAAGEIMPQIDFNQILDCWHSQEISHAVIMVGQVSLHVHFFCESEIEHDLQPEEVTSEEDHNSIVSYMQSMSQRLDRKVILTPENGQNFPLIIVENNEIHIVPCE